MDTKPLTTIQSQGKRRQKRASQELQAANANLGNARKTEQVPAAGRHGAALDALGQRLSAHAVTAGTTTVTVSRPDEFRLLHGLHWDDLQSFAEKHHLHVSARMRGRIYDFTRTQDVENEPPRSARKPGRGRARTKINDGPVLRS